jgi:hypothetical protein
MTSSLPNPQVNLAVLHAVAVGAERAAQLPQGERPGDTAAILARYFPFLAGHLAARYYLEADAAADCLEAFIAEKAWQPDMLPHLDHRAGTFRRLLSYSLHCFVLNQLRSAGGERGGLATWFRSIEEFYGDDWTQVWIQAVHAFELAWARGTLAEALRRMESCCRGSQQLPIWQLFECLVLLPMLNGTKPPAYPELVARFGLLSPSQAALLLRFGRRFFRLCLRAVVAEYVHDDAEIDEEIRQLQEVLRSAA